MKAIILCAGEGKRLRPLTEKTPKCLLPYSSHTDLTFIERLIGQLKKYKIEEIVVVAGFQRDKITDKIIDIKGTSVIVNREYKKDTNIYSMLLALDKTRYYEDIVVFEADVIAEDELINYVTGPDFEDKSVWFTSGKFKPDQSGGIISTDKLGNVNELRVVDKYQSQFADYEKLTGVMRIAKSELKLFHRFLELYIKMHTDIYYLIPWADNIEFLPSVTADISNYRFATFNTPEDYADILCNVFDTRLESRGVYLVQVNSLLPIESCDKSRVQKIEHYVIQMDKWVIPLRIEKNDNLVLDGAHSLELARQRGFDKVPVIGFNYEEVDMWSLRKDIRLTKGAVTKNAKMGKIYPYKTVKHKFPNVECKCDVPLEELK